MRTNALYNTQSSTAQITVKEISPIALINDIFRSAVPFGDVNGIPGRAVMTRGIADLGPRFVAATIEAVISFEDFTEGNDPYGEHDFEVIEVEGKRVLWKIDYYADDTCTSGASDPADCTRTYRLMSVMLAGEY